MVGTTILNPHMICLIQEPYTNENRLVTLPRGMHCYPCGLDHPHMAVFVLRRLRPQGLPHLSNRNCTAILIPGTTHLILVPSLYMDIILPVELDCLTELLMTRDHTCFLQSIELSLCPCSQSARYNIIFMGFERFITRDFCYFSEEYRENCVNGITNEKNVFQFCCSD